MPESLHTIEGLVGTAASGRPVTGHHCATPLKRKRDGSWLGSGPGQRTAEPSPLQIANLGLAAVAGAPFEAPLTVERYGTGLLLESWTSFRGGKPAGEPVKFHGALDRPLEVAGLRVGRTLVETFAGWIEDFAGPRGGELAQIPFAVRIAKHDRLPAAVVTIGGGEDYEQLSFFAADAAQAFLFGGPALKQRVTHLVHLEGEFFHELAAIWARTWPSEPKREGAATPGRAATPSDQPSSRGSTTPARHKAAGLDNRNVVSACASVQAALEGRW